MTVSFPREFEILFLSAHVDMSEAQHRALEQALSGQVDWNALIALASDHALLALVCHNLLKMPAQLLPPEIREAAEIHLADNAARNQAMTQDLLVLLGALAEKNLDAIPFKGPLLAETLYGDLSLRRFRDLDFLIRESQIDEVMQVLSTLGFKTTSDRTPRQEVGFRKYAGEYILFGKDHPAPVEPHWAFAPSTFGVDLDYDAIFERAFGGEISGQQVTVLAPEDALLSLCLHGSKERWARLQWLVDINEFMNKNRELDWQVVLDRARGVGCCRMVLLAVVLCARNLGFQPPDLLAQALRRDQICTQIAERIEKIWVEEPARLARSIYLLDPLIIAMRERSFHVTRYILRTLTTPRQQHYSIVALPSIFFWGYWPIKLVHDYLLLPVWIGGKRLLDKKKGVPKDTPIQ